MRFSERAESGVVPLSLVVQTASGTLRGRLGPQDVAWAAATGFSAKPGTLCMVPDSAGGLARVLVGVEESAEPGGGIWDLAGLPTHLPRGAYRLDATLSDDAATRAALGWSLGHYQFDRYRKTKALEPQLVWPQNTRRSEVTRLTTGIELIRDLINTPAADLGPADLAAAAASLARSHRASISVIVGQDLLKLNYPSIHAVGRAAAQEPRLIDITWGDAAAPRVTLVGKGVCFDSGGLDIKASNGMRNMKKDMGGAAHALGLAQMIMDADLHLRLRVLVPAVENAISSNAFRPLDVLATRKGLTVEVGNTDAEGRLVLSDALAEASSDKPDMIIDFATLTGAARVALGPDLPALFSNDDALADTLLWHGMKTSDALWRMPLWQPYGQDLASNVADLSSTGTKPLAGAIKAALFLERFVDPAIPWAHFDLMAWNTASRPGRPEGGEAMGVRAIYGMLQEKFG